MPQLNPEPWFSIIMTSWLIFILMTSMKTVKHTFLNEPNLKKTKTSPNTWTWPWQ